MIMVNQDELSIGNESYCDDYFPAIWQWYVIHYWFLTILDGWQCAIGHL
jgi:hypothetical protein